VELFRSYCLPVILYAAEVMPLSKQSLKSLDLCIKQAVAKFFRTYDDSCINEIRRFCDLPDVGVMIERRRMKFVDRILDVEHLACLIYVR